MLKPETQVRILLGTPLNITVNIKDLNVNTKISIDIILQVFENKDFRYQIKKSNRIKILEYYHDFYKEYINLKSSLLGNTIAYGGKKRVYQSKNCSNEVIKVAKKLPCRWLEEEKENYVFLTSLGLEHLLPTTKFFNFFCIAEKAEKLSPQHDINKTLKNITTDNGLYNFGVIKESQVLLDFKRIDRSYAIKNVDRLKNLYHS